MPKLKVDISMSLDGFVGGPDQTLEEPLGRGGNQLHEWAFAVQAWREAHGLDGGETNVDNEVVEEGILRVGATVTMTWPWQGERTWSSSTCGRGSSTKSSFTWR